MLDLAAGDYWLLVSDDGGGAEALDADAVWHVRARCEGEAAPRADEPCGRWRSCSACVARAQCGWCASSASCHAGLVEGALLAHCAEWDPYGRTCAAPRPAPPAPAPAPHVAAARAATDAAAARRVGAWAAVGAAALGLGLACVGAILRARWQRTVRAQLV